MAMISRPLLVVTGCACMLLAPAARADNVPLIVGGTTIQFPAESGYVQASTSAPQIFAVTQAGLPPTIRLVELFETSADLARQQAGQPMQDPFYEVQLVREIEDKRVGLDEFKDALPQLTAGMAKADLNAMAARELSGSNGRMSSAAGQKVDLSLGPISQPQIYRQTPTSFSYTMSVPVQAHVGAQSASATMGVAGSMLVAGNKLVDINVYSQTASPAAMADLRDRLDRSVDQTIALNPSGSGSFDWSKVGKNAMIWAIIGALIGLFAKVFRRT